jgi:hypothetical protein
MARIRAIHARATQDDDFASLPMDARLLWAYLPCYADRQGRLEDRPLVLKGSVFPTDNVVGSMLDAFQERGWIIRYQAGGKKLIQIVSFLDYQRPDHHEKESVLPGPPGWEQGSTRQNAQAMPRPRPGNTETSVGSSEESPGKADPVIRDLGDPVSPVEIPPNARVCDPYATKEEHEALHGNPMTGQDLLRIFGRVRSQVFPETLPWKTARDPKGDAGTLASSLGPEEMAAVEPSMLLALEHIRDGIGRWSDSRNSDVSFAFGSWKSAFHALREELKGVAPVANVVPSVSTDRRNRPAPGLSQKMLEKYGLAPAAQGGNRERKPRTEDAPGKREGRLDSHVDAAVRPSLRPASS